jgi:hypothetical protein
MGMNQQTTSDPRRLRRYQLRRASLRVTWLDDTGRMRVAQSRAINVSEEGIALELPHAALPEMVRIESKSLKFSGRGVVRYCRPAGDKFIVGVKFTGDLRWRPPKGKIHEPIPLCSPEVSFGQRLVHWLETGEVVPG